MVNTVVFIYLGIVIVMIITAITLGRRRPNSHLNDDTTEALDYADFGSNDTHHDHHYTEPRR